MTAEDPVLAIDIGGSTTKTAIVRRDGTVQMLETIPTRPPAESFLDFLAEYARRTGGAGVSVAGFVDDAGSAMVYNPNLPWLEGYPIRDELSRRLGVPVILDAYSNAACLAEHRWGFGRGSERFLCLTLGTGVGGGMIVRGQIVRLAHGGLGDIGHVIVDPAGPACGSGCRGCAKAMISAPAVEARAGGASAREVVERANKGDTRALDLLAETGRLLGVALASYCAILFPDAIAVAGGLAEAGELLIGPARKTVEALSGPFYRRRLRIGKATLGWQAPVAGAGALWFARRDQLA